MVSALERNTQRGMQKITEKKIKQKIPSRHHTTYLLGHGHVPNDKHLRSVLPPKNVFHTKRDIQSPEGFQAQQQIHKKGPGYTILSYEI